MPNSNIDTKLCTVDARGRHHNQHPAMFFFPIGLFPAPAPGDSLAIRRGNEKSRAWTCLKRRTLFTTHEALAARQQQSSQSTYGVYQGGDWSSLSSSTLPICHRETERTSAEPIKETLPEVNLLICQLAMTKMTFYQFDYYFRAAEPTSDAVSLTRGPPFCRVRAEFTIVLQQRLTTGCSHYWGYSSVDEESKHLSLTSPVFSISSAHLHLSPPPLHCPLSSNVWPSWTTHD